MNKINDLSEKLLTTKLGSPRSFNFIFKTFFSFSYCCYWRKLKSLREIIEMFLSDRQQWLCTFLAVYLLCVSLYLCSITQHFYQSQCLDSFEDDFFYCCFPLVFALERFMHFLHHTCEFNIFSVYLIEGDYKFFVVHQ